MKISICLFILFLAFALVGACSSVSESNKRDVPDSQIQEAITKKLGIATIDKVSVTVQDGSVTLTGQVLAAAVRNQVEAIAKSVEGVKSVQNNLAIVAMTPGTTRESEIANNEPTSVYEEAEPPSLESEAYDVAQKFVDKMVTKCGETYFFGTNSGTVFECRHPPEITIDGKSFEPRELSEADRLNNVDAFPVEWDGFARIELRVCRNPSGGYVNNKFRKMWSSWRDYPEKLVLNLKKAKGKWRSDQEQGKLQAPRYNVAVSCAKVNEINKEMSGG